MPVHRTGVVVTKGVLAVGMLHRAVAAGMPFGYVAGGRGLRPQREAARRVGAGRLRLRSWSRLRLPREPPPRRPIRVDHAVADVPAWGCEHRSRARVRKGCAPTPGPGSAWTGRLPRRLGTQPADPPRPRPRSRRRRVRLLPVLPPAGDHPWRADRCCRAPVGHRGVFRDRQVRGRPRRAPARPLDGLDRHAMVAMLAAPFLTAPRPRLGDRTADRWAIPPGLQRDPPHWQRPCSTSTEGSGSSCGGHPGGTATNPARSCPTPAPRQAGQHPATGGSLLPKDQLEVPL